MIHLLFKLKNKIAFIDLVYTGKYSGTGGRIKIAYDMLKLKEDIFMTYSDGLSNVSIKKKCLYVCTLVYSRLNSCPQLILIISI